MAVTIFLEPKNPTAHSSFLHKSRIIIKNTGNDATKKKPHVAKSDISRFIFKIFQ